VVTSGLNNPRQLSLVDNGVLFADITQYETDHDPDGQGFDSDPYAVVARDTTRSSRTRPATTSCASTSTAT
jgi:hypothetical protein